MATGLTATCDACAAVCCRLEVLCITDRALPARFVEDQGDDIPTMRRLADGWCAALDRTTLRCGIYADRPLPCREFEMGGKDCLAVRAAWVSNGS